jgi:hypothetical protein
MIARLIPFVLALALALPGASRSASAQSDPSRGVLVYCDQRAGYAERVCPQEHWSLLFEVYGAMGLNVEVLGSLPADLTQYRLVFVAIPGRPLEPAEQRVLADYLRHGRLLALIGENDEFFGDTLPHLNALLEPLDVDARFGEGALDAACGHTSASVSSHRLTEGVEGYDYAYTTTVTGGTPLVLHPETGAALVTWSRVGPNGPPNGEVVLFGDANPFIDDCQRDNTARLLQNMAQPR